MPNSNRAIEPQAQVGKVLFMFHLGDLPAVGIPSRESFVTRTRSLFSAV